MAENLRFKTEYSECYDYDADLAEYCTKYMPNETPEVCVEKFCEISGQYYNLVVNQDEYGLLDREIVDSICPKGWHLPSVDEWTILAESVDALGRGNAIEEKRMNSSDSTFFLKYMYAIGTNDCGYFSMPFGKKI